MAKIYKTGLVITGDASGGVKAVEATRAQLDKLDRAQRNTAKNSNEFGKALSSAGTKLVAWTAGIAGASSIFSQFSNQLAEIDSIGKLSDRIGASTEALTEYKHVAELTGVSFDALTKAWQVQSKNLAEASQGTGAAKQALDALGLSASALKQLAPEAQFEILADSLDGVANQGDKVRLAMQLWGEEGVALLQTTKGGAESIRAMRDEAKSLGLSLSGDQVDNVESFNDSVTRLSNGLKGAFLPLVIEITTELSGFTTMLAENSDVVAAGMRTTAEVLAGAAAAYGVYRVAAVAATSQNLLFASSMTAIKTAAAPVFAAFAGWKIGEFLREEFVEARVAALAFVGAINKGWEALKYAFNNLVDGLKASWTIGLGVMRDEFVNLIHAVSDILKYIPGFDEFADKLKKFAGEANNSSKATDELQASLAANEAAYKKAIGQIDDTVTSLISYELNADQAEKGTKKLTKTVTDLNPPLAKTKGNVDGLAEAYKKAHEEQTKFAGELESLRRKLDPVYSKTQDYRDEQRLLNEAHEKGLLTLPQYVDLLGLLDAKYRDTKDTVEKTSVATNEFVETSVEKADDFTKAWEKAVERIDESFASAWKGAFKSFEEFRASLLDSLKGLAAEIAHQNITKPLIAQFTSGGGGLNLGLSGLFQGSSATALGKGGQTVIGADAALGQTGISGALQGGAIAATAALTAQALATIFDDNASNSRRRNNIALLTGGLGALLPSSIFGKPSDFTQESTVRLGDGRIISQTGDKFDQGNRDAADIAGALLGEITGALSDKIGREIEGQLRFIVGSRDGIRFDTGEGTPDIFRGPDVKSAFDAATQHLFELAGVQSQVYQDLQREGETLAESLTRVDAQFNIVSSISDKLNFNFGAVGDAGLRAADALIEAVGGLDAFIAQTDYFYRNFYTEEERLQKVVDQSTKALNDFNDAFGTNIMDKAGLRDFADSLDLATEAGIQAHAAVLELAPALVDLGTASDRLAELAKEALVVMEDPLETAVQVIGELVAMDDPLENIGETAIQTAKDLEEAAEKMRNLTNSANELSGELSREAILSGLSGQDKEVFLLNEWRDSMIGKIEQFTDQGVDVLDGLINVSTIYGNRLQDINERYQEGAEIIEDAVNAFDPTNLQIRLLKAQGKDGSALALARQAEMDAADDAARPLLQAIYKAEDLNDLIERREDLLNQIEDQQNGVLEQWLDAGRQVSSFLRDITFSDLSPLTSSQRFAAAESQFSNTFNAALSGDLSAAQNFDAVARRFLTEAQDRFASSVQYVDIFNDVLSKASQVQSSASGKTLGDLNYQVSQDTLNQIRTLSDQIDAINTRNDEEHWKRQEQLVQTIKDQTTEIVRSLLRVDTTLTTGINVNKSASDSLRQV